MPEYYAVIRSTDHLAHYGVKGMRWGVRKAIAYGNEKALDRHFRKAAKKLRKLTDIGMNSPKYAAKAAAYGAAAAGTASVAGLGTKGIANYLGRKAKKYNDLASSIINGHINLSPEKAARLNAYATRASKTAQNINEWGKKKSSIFKGYNKVVQDADGTYGYVRTKGLTKNQVLRAGSGLAALGLAAKAGQNAYRASHGAKYRAKASNFKTEMDNAFKGTKYEGKYIALPKKRKRG